MTFEALEQRARPVIAVAATLFVVDLFLGFQPAKSGRRSRARARRGPRGRPTTVAPHGRS